MDAMILLRSMLSLMLLLGSSCQDTILIPFPPTMILQPPHDLLFQVSNTEREFDRPFILECEADANPEPEYRWTKDNEEFDYTSQNMRISRQPGRGTLIFTQPVDTDEGLYQCFAKNIHGTSVSNAVRLRKSELGSFPVEDPKEIFVMEGGLLTLHCNPPSGFPKPKISWIIFSDDGAIRSINSSRITVDPNGDLHFSYVTEEDALDDAKYACIATSVFPNEYKLGNKIILRVESSGRWMPSRIPPIKLYTSPSNITVLRGQKLELSCIYGGTPLPGMIWSKKDGILPSKRTSYANYGKTLKIRNVDFQDEGKYECIANNDIGVPSSHSMAVTVQAAPFWIISPRDKYASEDETVSFECTADGKPAPDVQWFMNGIPLEDAVPNPRRKLDSTVNVLTLENLEKSDTAVFQCNASNVHGYAFHDFYLNVLAIAAIITESPEPETMAILNSVVTLPCRSFGQPNPSVKWMKKGRKLNKKRYQVQDNGDLMIINVSQLDEGNYTCYVSNRFGNDRAITRLDVKEKTRITATPSQLEVAAGRSATLRCRAEADPSLELNIVWLFNNQTINYDDFPRILKKIDHSLTITRTVELDSGVYTCVAKTELDQSEAQITLVVQDIPNPPIVTDVQCDGFSAMVYWQPTGDGRTPILSYVIQYNTSFTPDTWEDVSATIPATDTSFIIRLSPWANYTFRVIARNKIGRSLPSGHSEVCENAEDVPYQNPDNVDGKSTEKGNLVITWTPMPMIEHNAPGFVYKVFWKRNDLSSARWEQQEINDWQQGQLTIGNLPSFKPYRIKVEAHNRNGEAHVAATTIIRYSGEDVPLEAPKNFIGKFVGEGTAAKFSWDPVSYPSIRGRFKGYKIQTWIENQEEERREIIVKPDTTKVLVNDLRPASRIFAHVLAFNSIYNGPASNVVNFITPEGTPGPVKIFNVIALGPNSLYMKWKPPLEPNGMLTGYNIYYNEEGTMVGETQERRPQISNPKERLATLIGLRPNTQYMLNIKATTKKGEGDPYVIEVKTEPEETHVVEV